MATILIVDDTPDNVVLLQTLLHMHSYTVHTATDGYAALHEIRRNAPDLILMDLAMPRLNGWDTIQALKADPKLSTIPVIALSAHVQDVDRERAIKAGCDAYMMKPFDLSSLLATIQHHLSLTVTA